MKTSIKNLTTIVLRSLLVGAVVVCNVYAEENPSTTPPSRPKCKKSGSGGSNSSFYYYCEIGDASYDKADMLTMARKPVAVGSYLGQNPDTFDAFFDASYTQNVVSNRSPLDLTIETVTLDESVLVPSTLKVKRPASVEVIDKNGAIRQVLTSDTLADVVPMAVGFHVKVYDRVALGAKDSEGLYTLIGSPVPIMEWIMRTPDGGAFVDTVDAVFIDRRNAGGVRVEIRRFSRDMTADTRLKETFEGSLDVNGNVVIGTLLETDEVTYSNRGTKPYDYTLEREVKSITTTGAGAQAGTLKLVSHRLEEYRDFTPSTEGGQAAYKRLVREVEGYGTPEALETRYTWYDQPSNLMLHGRLKTTLSPSGNWELYQYTDSEGAAVFEQVKYSAWRDASFGTAADGSGADLSNARKEVISVGSTTSFTKSISHAGVLTSKEEFSSIPQADGSLLNTLTHKSATGTVLSTRVWSLNSASAEPYKAGKIAWMENPDGTAETYSYTDLSGGDFRLVHRKGAGTRNGVNAGTEIIADYNSFDEAYAETAKDIETGLTISYWTAPSVDILGRPTRIEYNGNANDYETFQYSCCGLAHKRDRDASITTYDRDALRRVYRQQSYRFDGDTAPITSSTTYDGLTQTVTRGGILVRATSNLMNGELESELGPDQDGDGNPEETTYATSYPTSGGKIITITYPDSGTNVETSYIDGQPKSVTGTAVHDRSYAYGTHNLSGGGLFTKVTKLTATGGTDEWEKTYEDAINRQIQIEYPSDLDANGILDRIRYIYYPIGASSGDRTQLHYFDDADGKRVTYNYNTEGEQLSVTEQMTAGQNRGTLTSHDVVNDTELGVCHRTTTTVNGVVTNVTLNSGDGYVARSTSLGNTTTTTKTPSTAAGNSTLTTTLPDSTKQVKTTEGNLLVKTATLDTSGNEMQSVTYGYDALRRLISSTDSRTGTTWFAGMVDEDNDPQTPDTRGASANFTDAGQRAYVEDPGGRVTTYAYDVMGRRVSVDAPDTTDAAGNALANITSTSYYPTGQTKAVWGDQTNAVFRIYDEQNRIAELRTYRALVHGTEPTATTVGADATTWAYHPQRGFLTRKEYADQKGTDYTYTPAGKIKMRTWARSVNSALLTTSYTYDKGLLTFTDYSDTTPDVTISYDAFGRKDSVTQANQSQIIYQYDPSTLAIDTETISYDLDHDGTADFSRVLDRKPTSLGRETGWQLLDGTTVENEATYGYHAATGRLQTVAGNTNVGSFEYAYVPNSNLIDTVTGPAHTVTNTWKTDRDILDLKENEVGSTVISSYDYAVNDLGQRTGVSQAGTAFAAARAWDWGYDPLGQVTKADHDADNTFDRAYQYDAIGNRTESGTGVPPASQNTTYTANSLNQYSAIGTLSPIHDDDGNATSYPLPANPTALSTLTWDAENRMKSATVNGTTTTYLYDAQSRLISRSVGGSPTSTTLYLYDGWNRIAEYQSGTAGSPALDKTYTWGLDLSNSLQGAGGVGGLFAVTIHNPQSSIYYPTSDGNGNISEYLASSGSVAAHFEYDPFGNTVVDTDTTGQFAYRFSTKPKDDSTGLYYYQYRHYDPATGRWLSRDPIGEEGGVCLYVYIGNGAPNFFDILGLAKPKTDWQCQQHCIKTCRNNGGAYNGHTFKTYPRSVMLGGARVTITIFDCLCKKCKKKGGSCSCDVRCVGKENPPQSCPSTVHGIGETAGDCQRDAKSRVAENCRKFVGHCQFTKR